MVNDLNNSDGCVSRRTAFLAVDHVHDFEVERQIRLEVVDWIACIVWNAVLSVN